MSIRLLLLLWLVFDIGFVAGCWWVAAHGRRS